NQKPVVAVSSAAVCTGATGTLTATVTGQAGATFSYAWTGPAGSGPFGNTASITVSIAGTYNVTVTDSNGCTGTGSGVLVLNPRPVVAVNNPSTCAGIPTAMTATVTGSSAAPFHYVWTGPAGTGPFGDSSSIVASVAGTYSVTVTDANGCTGTGSGVLRVNPNPVVTVNNAAVCAGSPAALTATVSGSTAAPFS